MAVKLHSVGVPLEESVLHCQAKTSCYVDSDIISSGTLYVTSSNVLWMNDEQKGFAVNYDSISVHAISKAINYFPHPCIYMMVSELSCEYDKARNKNCNLEANGHDVEKDDEDEEDDDHEDRIIDLRFVPSDVNSLNAIYEAINKGSCLNPCAEDADLSEDDNFEPVEEMGQGDGVENANGNDDVEDENGEGDPDQFANADEEEGGAADVDESAMEG
ncbi:hypothetical protein HELRODRAFT_170760 [Helobdella robusta]|uniref:Methylosome subunit pICln n=1 Tax=Helobdella robusta TaxID=6412 RepID=T1F3E1_HELRO|nr:hypothetical protein HELRODRAFT_170760 [Helobdella robusta]ESO07426.1 hypothetical protein HELRODRAFT_170760 [Helobdella robusta]